MHINWETYRPQLTDVGRSRWARGTVVERSWAESPSVVDHDLWYITGGSGKIRLRSGWADLVPGACTWMRPGWRYEVRQNPEDPLSLTFIHFVLIDPAGRPLPSDAPMPPEYHDPPDPQFVEMVTRRIVEMSWGFELHGVASVPANEPASILGRQMLMALLMQLDMASDQTTAGGKLTGHQRRAMEHAASRILEHPREVPPVPELARQAGYSKDHFIRVFRHATGVTPQKFVVQARTRLAQRMLRETEMTVGEIAEAAGYRDIYFFSRQFKKVVGTSPSTYRKRCAPAAIRSQ